MQTYLTLWLAQVNQFTPQEFYTGGWASPTDTTNPNTPADGSYSNQIAYMIPRFSYYGVSSTIINQIIAWAASVWPNYNWAGLTETTCSAAKPDLICSPWP
jgi:hypothetical protein